MDFNKIMQDIMTFISEHTLLLIGICVFLILVLIGYLIDNSVKSKRVRNDIKNADQVPENIKEEIIKKAEETGVVKKNDNVEAVTLETKEETKEQVDTNPNNNENKEVVIENTENKVETSDLNASLNLDSNTQTVEQNGELNLDASLNVQDAQLDNLVGDNNTVFGADINLDNNVTLTDKQADSLSFNLDSGIISDTPAVDPDAYLMNNVESNNEYTNNKSLSEILSNNISLNQNENNFVNETPLNIEINANNVESTGSNEPQDELEKIMQKLSAIKTDTEEDNYTNIF